MVAPVNEFDTRLRAETQRTLAPRGGVILSTSANVVNVAAGTGTPSVITLKATPISLVGTVVFTTSPTVPLTIDSTGLIATLHYSDMGTSSVVVTATLTANGIPYVDSQTISQVSIGQLGYTGDLNATNGATLGVNVGGQITSTNSGGLLGNGAVSLPQINTASIGTLSALTATIGTLRTATTGGRVELKDNVLKVFDTANAVRTILGNLLL